MEEKESDGNDRDVWLTWLAGTELFADEGRGVELNNDV